MRSSRWSKRDLGQLARSGRPGFALPAGLADRVRAAMSAAPPAERSSQPRLGRAKWLVVAAGLLVVLAVVVGLAVRSPDARQVTGLTAAVGSDDADEHRPARVADMQSPRREEASGMEPAPAKAVHAG